MKIIVKGMAIEYSDEGSGAVLLFLHGWKNDLHSFDLITGDLSKSWRVIRVDLPGFGNSEPPATSWGVSDYVNFVDSFIKKIDVEPYSIIGHSLGGRITIKGLAENIFLSKKNILIASAGVAKRKNLRSIILKILAKIIKMIILIPPFIFFREKIRSRLYKKIGSDYLTAGNLKETFIKIINEDLSAFAKRIKTPTLLIWGENDIQTPLSEARYLSNLIPDSELQVIEGASHFVHQEYPEKVVKLINKFLL